MPANNSSTHHYLLIFKSQFYVNNKQIHLEADPSAHRLHRHSHRHHPRRHQLHGHVMTIAAGINHDARPFRCYMPFYSQCAKNLRSLMNTAENILCAKNLRSLMSSAINKQCANNQLSVINYQSSSLLLIIPFTVY